MLSRVSNSTSLIGSVESVAEKNPKLIARLEMVPDVLALVDGKSPALVGALKSTPVEMIRFSDIGLQMSEEITIQSPWGEQTKPADQEGFLVWDTSQDMYYMVNQGENGHPLGYIAHSQ